MTRSTIPPQEGLTPGQAIAGSEATDPAASRAAALAAGGGLRRTVARGTIVNTAFLVAVSVLGFLKGFLVAGFLSVEEYGRWAVIVVAVTTLTWLLSSGFGQKFVQQDEPDQEAALQKAFTLELIFGAGAFVLMAALLGPILVAYGQLQLLPAAIVLGLALPLSAFSAPIWVFYREMRYARQRSLEAVNPVVAFVLTIGLAALGAGYWSLVAGIVAGTLAAAATAVAASPYPLRLRYDRATAREYVAFSWPLVIYGAGGLAVAQTALLLGRWELGLAAVGAIGLTATITQLAERVDQIVTGTLYPAICAVKDRTDVLFETFVKSNRLALMWGMPFGVGLALFAPDVVTFVLGEKWRLAVGLVQVLGLIAAANQIGFNWDAFYRAQGRTRPLAVVSAITATAFVAVAVPGMLTWGLDGFAAAMAASTAAALAARGYYLTRLFPGFAVARHLARAVAPSVPAAAAILLVRLAEQGTRSPLEAAAELALYLAVTVAATAFFERALIAEVLDYLRGRRRVTALG